MKTLNSSITFLVVGAGPAGLSCALSLRAQGHRVVVWDRSRGIGRQVCGEYLTPEGRELALKMGQGEELKDFAPVCGMQIFSPQGTKLNCFFPFKAYGLSLNRELWLQRLVVRAKALGVEVMWGRPLLGVELTDKGLRARSEHEELAVDYIIGADGRQSKVARFLGLDGSTVMDEKRVAIHCYLKPLRALSRQGQMHLFGDGSYIGLNPISPTEVNVSIVLGVERLKAFASPKDALNFYLAQSTQLAELFPAITQEEVRVAFPLGRRAKLIHHERGCLIGDAAGFIDPLTGEGITSALKTAYLLSESVKHANTVTEAFAQYAQQRRTLFEEKERLNYGFQWLIRHAELVQVIGFLLARSQYVRDLFIGIIGNVLTPKAALKSWLTNFQEERHGQSYRRQ